MKAMELRRKSSEELSHILRERLLRYEEVAQLVREKKQKNVKEFREIRKDVARIQTILNEQRLP